MRSVCFVDHLELEFPGNVLDRGICLGDIDNDGGCELLVANVAGDLHIYKGKTTKPWRQFSGLGMIACITVGDICNISQNVLCCITSEGWSHLMYFGHENKQRGSEETKNTSDYIATFHQSLPTNSKVAIVADVDGDGDKEVVIGSTDRVVRVFKWMKEIKKDSPDRKSKEKTVGKQNSKEEKNVLKKQNSKEGKGLLKQSSSKEETKGTGDDWSENTSTSSQESSTIFNGKLVCVKRWKLSGQLESLSVLEGENGSRPTIVVSQPGGSYLYLFCAEESLKDNLEKQTKQLTIQDSAFSFSDCRSSTENVIPHHLLAHTDDMFSIPTHLVTWSWKPTRSGTTSSNYIAMCTLSGTLAVIKDDKKYWSVDLKHNFFTIQKLDITQSGREDIVFCAWDGETFIMDQYQNIVNFKFGEDIAAFSAGTYGIEGEASVPCLVYVTFANRIKLYWNVGMDRLESRNFTDSVVAKLASLNLDPKYRDFMESENGSLDNTKIKQLTRWCLYGGIRGDTDLDT